MTDPDWYSGWRHNAVHELVAKNARLSKEFQLDACSRYEFDLAAGTLFFLNGDVVQVFAEVQLAGSTSGRAKNWLWAWGNGHFIDKMALFSQNARAFGERNSIEELTSDIVESDDLNGLGWALTAVTTKVNDALGAYRPPRDDGGGIFLVYKSMSWAS